MRDSFDKEIEDTERELRILRLSKLLVKAYYKTGSMSVMLNDGRQVTDRPAFVADSYAFFRNIHSKALEMARLAVLSPGSPSAPWRY